MVSKKRNQTSITRYTTVKKHKRKGHKRVKDGKVEYVKPATVSEYKREKPKPQISERKKGEIKEGKARDLLDNETKEFLSNFKDNRYLDKSGIKDEDIDMNKYYCWYCGGEHRYTSSDIGKRHLDGGQSMSKIPHSEIYDLEEIKRSMSIEDINRKLSKINNRLADNIRDKERLKLLKRKKDYSEALDIMKREEYERKEKEAKKNAPKIRKKLLKELEEYGIDVEVKPSKYQQDKDVFKIDGKYGALKTKYNYNGSYLVPALSKKPEYAFDSVKGNEWLEMVLESQKEKEEKDVK
jgi:hypothetical protein